MTPTELKKVPITGGTPIALCKVNRARGASWGPDNTIVFAPNRSSGLFKVPAAGGEPVPVTVLDTENGEAAHYWPQVVPGGRVIFTVLHQGSGVADDGVIESVDLATGERKVLHRGGAYGRWVPVTRNGPGDNKNVMSSFDPAVRPTVDPTEPCRIDQ